MAKYQLLDIALKQAFANNGLTQRVPYQLPPQEDNLNWLEGFTDAFQRPVLPQADAGNANGRYIKMGQLNQVLQNLSQAILNVKQGLDNVQGTIDNDTSIKIENVIKEVDEALKNKVVTWLQTINNQNCAGLKNFQGININNFKTKTNAVANLEWCNGLPIKSYYSALTNGEPQNYTITQKNVLVVYSYFYGGGSPDYASFINDWLLSDMDTCGDSGCGVSTYMSMCSVLASKGDIIRQISGRIRNQTTYSIYGV